MAKYQADKLQRWSLIMSTFNYKIEVLPGVDNVWADLLSRWGMAQHYGPTLRADPCFGDRTRLTLDQSRLRLAIPSRDCRHPTRSPPSVGGEEGAVIQWNDDAGYFRTAKNKIWLPQAEIALKLRMRIAVVAHMGIGGL